MNSRDANDVVPAVKIDCAVRWALPELLTYAFRYKNMTLDGLNELLRALRQVIEARQPARSDAR